MHRLLIIILLFIFWKNAFSQETVPDTVINLQLVTISEPKETLFTQGLRVAVIDAAAMQAPANSSLGELISRETPAYVKSYGQGSIATISMRGASASHTGILWNGLNLYQPSTGMTDLSLVKSAFFEDIALVYGGSSVLFGSGMIGGAILLGHEPSFYDHGRIRLEFNTGSFGRKEALAGFYFGKENLSSRTIFAISGSKNDFPYRDPSGNIVELPHAATENAGFIHDLSLVTGEDSDLQVAVWYQDASREVPPTSIMAVSEAVLYDRFVRTMANWNLSREKYELQVTGGYFNELETYRDPLAEVSSRIYNQTAVIKIGNRIVTGKNQQLLAGISGRMEIADIDAYQEVKSDLRSSLYGSYLVLFPSIGWKGSLGARLVADRDYPLSILPSVGLDGKISRNFPLRFNVSRNFRSPTLNERYWTPGGNPGLKPETSWNAEAGAGYEKKGASLELAFGATVFSYLVNDWILWVPRGALWYAENILQVWSRGVEIHGKQAFEPNDRWSLTLSENYHFTRATREKKISENDQGLGKQLIYTPVHSAGLKVAAGYRQYRVVTNINATGPVYTTTDNEHALPGYLLSDILLSARYPWRFHELEISLSVLNVFDEDYVVVEYRPMPGISFLASVKLFINVIRTDP